MHMGQHDIRMDSWRGMSLKLHDTMRSLYCLPCSHLVQEVEANVQGIPDENVSDRDDSGRQLGSGDLGNKADDGIGHAWMASSDMQLGPI